MKKKLLAIGMCAVMVLGMTACGSDSESGSSSDVQKMSYSDYNLEDYITVGDYKELEVAPYVINVTKDEIDKAVKSDLEAAQGKKDLAKGDELKEGDTANIDYVGKLDGKEFDGGSAKGHDLVLGSGSFIEGFESGLVGKKVGESVSLNLTFPENYGSEELAGKDVVFDVTINSATTPVAISEEKYVKEKTDYDSVEAYEAAKKKALEDRKTSTAKNDQVNSLWADALANVKVNEYPSRELEAYREFNNKQVEEQMKQYNMNKEEYAKAMGLSSAEELDTLNEDSCKARIKQEMAIEWIAANEGIEVTDEEIEKAQEEMAATGYTAEVLAQQTGRVAEEYLRTELLYQKIADILLDNSKSKGSAKEY